MKSNSFTRRAMSATVGAAVLLGAGLAGPAHAADKAYPNRTVTFIVPFPPGSATDTSARYFGKKLTDLTGQAVVIDNRPGGNGFIAVNAALNAKPDGYTVFFGSNSTLAVNAALFKKLPYDPVKDFKPLSLSVLTPAVLATPAGSKYKTMADLIAAAKANPGKLNYGAGSAGYQLMAELFNEQAKVKTTNIPFKGASESMQAIVANTIDFSFVEITSALELINSGKARGLALAHTQRVPAAKDIPTAAEAGLPGFTAYAWVGAMMPAKVPAAETKVMADLMTKIVQLPETKAFYEKLGAEAAKGGPAEFAAFQLKEIEQWKRIAKIAGVELQ
ncbi:ABC transporter substrate-binding protein [Comamonas serinivorans]|uniref:ABC transporter substrate-binding protein n=1 Tax=Comamonas serinivorans TaxID=1082851 RepID=A0A1Y0ENY0_9BURK|nr:tripartite tricarboxylate transporter substrate binding protein [Comamonas serinivorans]ARU05344.1 ABC transporter substrate-binding protein [Comamonas serinivorans]